MTDIRKIGPLPQIGIGTWNRSGEETYAMVLAALAAGYRHIDTAEGYRNEDQVGRAIAASRLKRADLFVTSKVSPRNLGPGQIVPHAKASLERLGLEKLDLYLIHWPAIKDQFDVRDYVAQLAEVREAGLSHHIGVSNFTRRHVDAAVAVLGRGQIATNQCEIHVFLQNRTIVDHCRAQGIAMTAYSPLARGAVAENKVLQEIAAKHGAGADQVALAFLMAEGHVVIPSSSNPARIVSNLAAKDITLDGDDMKRIRKLDEGRRLVDGDWCPVWDV